MTCPYSVRAYPLLQRSTETVSDSSFQISYAAHTATCTFLLDSDGICRRIVTAPNTSKRAVSQKTREAARAASRCIGAQYVASLDPSVLGMLAEMPRVGSAMLFARIDERGRVSLVRTGVVTQFERHHEDPFAEPADRAPSMSVETSAPIIAPSMPAPRFSRENVYGEEDSDRAGSTSRPPPPVSHVEIHVEVDDDATLERTSEYRSDPHARRTWPSPGMEPRKPVEPRKAVELSAPHGPPTLRQATPIVVALGSSDDENDPYAIRARSPLPRPSHPPPYSGNRTRSDRTPKTERVPRTNSGSHPQAPTMPGDKAAGGRRDR
jgi:hypothetical protein